jgi:large subunit ribosomal protein L10
MVAPWKKKEVEELAGKLKKSKIVGVVGIEGIPSKQLQRMRKKFGEKLEIRIARNNIIKHAIKKAKLNESLGEYLKGPSGLILTELSPFKLEKIISENKTTSPAKPGSISPKDIVIPKGDTPFAPGPIIGELQAVGIKAKIEGGKIVVLQDSTVVKAGEKVSPQLAAVLTRFSIEPIEICLHLHAALEEGFIYPGEVLHIDDNETKLKISSAYRNALNLSLNAKIMNSVTLPYFIRDSHIKALNLAFNSGVYTKETLEFMIGKANSQASALKSRIPEDPLKN